MQLHLFIRNVADGCSFKDLIFRYVIRVTSIQGFYYWPNSERCSYLTRACCIKMYYTCSIIKLINESLFLKFFYLDNDGRIYVGERGSYLLRLHPIGIIALTRYIVKEHVPIVTCSSECVPFRSASECINDKIILLAWMTIIFRLSINWLRCKL